MADERDNVIAVDFSSAAAFDRGVDALLDQHDVTDADLRADVHARARVWSERLGRLLIDHLPGPEPAPASRGDSALRDELASLVRELIGLATGQAVLEQRARRRGFSVVDDDE